ncbi:hypothetical protein [Streptomyces sp. SudanB182_2057]|uniref:hypothetical protein n=1 Tax=Streptomyces sp. SudanB182_2057 TaxID=3035281 RepID=UPI003F558B10
MTGQPVGVDAVKALPVACSEARPLVPALMFIALVVTAVGSLGTPLITSVATSFTLAVVVAGSALTVLPLPLPFAWLLAGRAAQGIGLGLTALMMGVARNHLPEERGAAVIALISVVPIIGAGVGYPLAALLAEFGGVRAVRRPQRRVLPGQRHRRPGPRRRHRPGRLFPDDGAYTTAALVGPGAMAITTLTSLALARRRASETNP